MTLSFNLKAIDALNDQDGRNNDLLGQVLTAADGLIRGNSTVDISDPQRYFDLNGDGDVTRDDYGLTPEEAAARQDFHEGDPDHNGIADQPEDGYRLQFVPDNLPPGSLPPGQLYPGRFFHVPSDRTLTMLNGELVALKNGAPANYGLMNEVANANDHGYLAWSGKVASLQGTGGAALLEFAKDAIQTAVSNISNAGTQEIVARKMAERKISSQA